MVPRSRRGRLARRTTRSPCPGGLLRRRMGPRRARDRGELHRHRANGTARRSLGDDVLHSVSDRSPPGPRRPCEDNASCIARGTGASAAPVLCRDRALGNRLARTLVGRRRCRRTRLWEMHEHLDAIGAVDPLGIRTDPDEIEALLASERAPRLELSSSTSSGGTPRSRGRGRRSRPTGSGARARQRRRPSRRARSARGDRPRLGGASALRTRAIPAHERPASPTPEATACRCRRARRRA